MSLAMFRKFSLITKVLTETLFGLESWKRKKIGKM